MILVLGAGGLLGSHLSYLFPDDIIGLTSWYKIHLFVNKTWIGNQGFDWMKLKGLPYINRSDVSVT